MAHFDSIFFDEESLEWMQRDSDEEHPDCLLFGGEMSETQTKLQELADTLKTEDQWEYQIAESPSGYY